MDENQNTEKVSEIEETVNEVTEKSLPEKLKEDTKTSAEGILKATNSDDLQKFVDIFNANIAKKNALRVMKLDELQDKVEEEVAKRFTKRSDDMSNTEVIQYYKAIQDSIKTSREVVNNKDTSATIQITTNQNITIPDKEVLNRDSKERVIDAVKNILNQIKNNTETQEVIDAEIVDETVVTEDKQVEAEKKEEGIDNGEK